MYKRPKRCTHIHSLHTALFWQGFLSGVRAQTQANMKKGLEGEKNVQSVVNHSPHQPRNSPKPLWYQVP